MSDYQPYGRADETGMPSLAQDAKRFPCLCYYVDGINGISCGRRLAGAGPCHGWTKIRCTVCTTCENGPTQCFNQGVGFTVDQPIGNAQVNGKFTAVYTAASKKVTAILDTVFKLGSHHPNVDAVMSSLLESYSVGTADPANVLAASNTSSGAFVNTNAAGLAGSSGSSRNQADRFGNNMMSGALGPPMMSGALGPPMMYGALGDPMMSGALGNLMASVGFGLGNSGSQVNAGNQSGSFGAVSGFNGFNANNPNTQPNPGIEFGATTAINRFSTSNSRTQPRGLSAIGSGRTGQVMGQVEPAVARFYGLTIQITGRTEYSNDLWDDKEARFYITVQSKKQLHVAEKQFMGDLFFGSILKVQESVPDDFAAGFRKEDASWRVAIRFQTEGLPTTYLNFDKVNRQSAKAKVTNLENSIKVDGGTNTSRAAPPPIYRPQQMSHMNSAPVPQMQAVGTMGVNPLGTGQISQGSNLGWTSQAGNVPHNTMGYVDPNTGVLSFPGYPAQGSEDQMDINSLW